MLFLAVANSYNTFFYLKKRRGEIIFAKPLRLDKDVDAKRVAARGSCFAPKVVRHYSNFDLNQTSLSPEPTPKCSNKSGCLLFFSICCHKL